MLVYQVIIILIVLVKLNSGFEESCSAEESMDEQCGSFCYKIVKPLLDYASLVRSKEQQFSQLENQIQEQSLELVDLQTRLKSSSEQSSQKDLLITAKDDLIRQMETNLSEKNNQLNQFNRDNENTIKRNDELIKSKDQQLELQRNLIKSLKASEKELNNTFQSASSQVLELNKQVEFLKSELNRISADSPSTSCLGKADGVHTMKVPGIEAFTVYCDSSLISIGLGWTVIQRRQNGRSDFFRTWLDYRNGFGDLTEEFFLGLKKLHYLTKYQKHELGIFLLDSNNSSEFCHYDLFEIDEEENNFKITELNYSTGYNPNMIILKNSQFRTLDRDDRSQNAKKHKSGWWFRGSVPSTPNGEYKLGKGIALGTKTYTFIQIMIRPKVK